MAGEISQAGQVAVAMVWKAAAVVLVVGAIATFVKIKAKRWIKEKRKNERREEEVALKAPRQYRRPK